jgi:hypothetical protein
VYELE